MRPVTLELTRRELLTVLSGIDPAESRPLHDRIEARLREQDDAARRAVGCAIEYLFNAFRCAAAGAWPGVTYYARSAERATDAALSWFGAGAR